MVPPERPVNSAKKTQVFVDKYPIPYNNYNNKGGIALFGEKCCRENYFCGR
jgi:hypothetical protein